MTLWLFGDTYTQPNNNPNQWMYKVAAELDTDIQSLALNGTALEFTYQRFNIARKKIEENDIVIVALTDLNRRWFFKAYPQYAEFDLSPTDNKKENKAIELFRKYLDHKEIHQIYLIDFLYNLYALTEEKNLHTILISDYKDVEDFITDKKDLFPLFNIANGNLIDITDNISDKELNCMSIDKNNFLADKIIDNIRNKTIINLK